MSRVANNPVTIPSGVEVSIAGSSVNIKGSKGSLTHTIPDAVEVLQKDTELRVKARDSANNANALSGTTRALLNNMVSGVSQGYEKKLQLVGVGYRVQAKGSVLNLTLGFSHPVEFSVPEGITIETPTQTDVIVKGIDKQQVGQVAANIRALRPPEPYKGKGVRYADEHIVRKEAKKK
ncbi:MAG: 50S ribosomal protein L6 [Gammaproteobacteria bacterium]|nr:50S ribosomal protein L6 [Gammaproteobacteria bacterium]